MKIWTGENVRLRALEREDLTITHKWINDPQIVEYEGHPFPVSMTDEENWFEALQSNDRRKVLIIETLADARPIGNIYFDINWRHRSVNISITIGEIDLQGKGYGTDAINTAVQHAFGELGLNRATANIFAFNHRSIKAFEKAGFQQEGLQRQSYMWHGDFQNQVMMSILRKDSRTSQR